jgi:hypothetical protein
MYINTKNPAEGRVFVDTDIRPEDLMALIETPVPQFDTKMVKPCQEQDTGAILEHTFLRSRTYIIFVAGVSALRSIVDTIPNELRRLYFAGPTRALSSRRILLIILNLHRKVSAINGRNEDLISSTEALGRLLALLRCTKDVL